MRLLRLVRPVWGVRVVVGVAVGAVGWGWRVSRGSGDGI